jgi:Ca2+-binding EF-hand superfamily protein
MCSKQDMINMANQLFDDYDANSNGSLERNEVKTIIQTIFNEVAKTHQIDEEKTNKMFTASDIDGDGKLSKEEFLKIVEMFLEPVYL